MRWIKCVIGIVLVTGIIASGCRKDVLKWKNAQQVEGLPGSRWNRIEVINDSIWIVAGGEKFARADVLITRDAGATWTHQTFPEMGKGLYGLDAGGDGAVVACGFSPVLLTGSAGLENWQTEPLPGERFYVAVSALPQGKRVLLSTVTQTTGHILLLDSNNHELKRDSLPFGLNDVCFVDDMNGYVSGYGAVMRTYDGGYSWSYTTASGDQFTSLDVHGRDTVYTCGSTGNILRTTDGGHSWQQLRSSSLFGKPSYALQDIVFSDARHGYCVGEDGLVIYTDDGGEHWVEYESFTSAHLRSIAVLPGGDLLVCGDGGALWRLKVR
jgi:photosystem II stability/assembly factor-like uncharacterized protein